jgi:hypothetical protein
VDPSPLNPKTSNSESHFLMTRWQFNVSIACWSSHLKFLVGNFI